MKLALRFVRGTGLDSKIIEWETRAWTSHVEFAYRNDEGGFDRTFGAQLKGGVLWRLVSDPCYADVVRTETWEIEIGYDQKMRLYEVITETMGLPYDWRAIIAFAFGERDWREPDSWFCSEWASMMLEKLGVAKFPQKVPFDRITPRDVYLIFTGLPSSQCVATTGGK